MKFFLRLILVCVFFATANVSSQTVYTSIQDGDWSSASTWSGGAHHQIL